MLVRTITGVVFALVMFAICFFSDTIVLPVAAAVFSVLAVWEMLGCIGTRKDLCISVPAYTIAAAFPLTCRLFPSQLAFIAVYALAFFCYLTWLFSVSMFSRGKTDVERVGMSFAALFYVLTPFSAMILLRDSDRGGYLLFMTLFAPWVTDVFAYFVGRLFGKHKLIPEISPKKTIEGSVGGAVFCVIAAILYALVIERVMPDVDSVSIPAFALAGLVLGVVSQIGDLILSTVKRRYGVKDYGFLLPGHGGILDRFDSVIGVMPIMLILRELSGTMAFFS